MDKARQADKRVRREERKAAEARARQVDDRKRRVRIGLVSLAAIVVVGAAGFFIVQKAIPSELPGVTSQPNDGRSHVPSGQTVAFASATPTSGTHSVNSPRCGVLDQQLPPEFAVHALEHGTVVIWYQPSVGEAVVSGLSDIVNRFDDRVILSPNAQLTEPVVATAWRRLKAYDDADPEIGEFIETYRNRGPEKVSCAY